MKEKETWKSLGIRTKCLYVSCAIAFIIGWALTIAAFIVPPLGEISNTVLVVLGQALTYAGAGFGMAQYVQYQIARFNFKNGGNMAVNDINCEENNDNDTNI